MTDESDDGAEIIGIGFRDTLTNMLGGLFALFMGALVLISPPKESEADTVPPGNLVVTIVWPAGDNDVDLLIYGPGEKRPIMYSNKAGAEWSLLRDDLGNTNDSIPINMENAFSRAVLAGRYYFGLKCYRCNSGPVKVSFELRAANMSGGSSSSLITANVELVENGQEITIVQLDLTAKGTIVPGSASNVFFPMFKAWS